MDMKRHMFIFIFFIHVGGLKKEWSSYKMDLVIRKSGR
jgi:hypothetical protein